MTSAVTPTVAAEVTNRFRFEGRVASVEAYGTGHIHHTFVVATSRRRYLLQRMNTLLFPDPAMVQRNILVVSAHLSTHADPGRAVLTVIPSSEEYPLVAAGDGSTWRAFAFIEGAHSRPALRSPTEAEAAGRAYGQFQRLLADVDRDRLAVTIPGFHDSRRHLARLVAVARADPRGRAGPAHCELTEALARDDLLEQVPDRLPLRVAHNDAKVDNLLVADDSGEPVCVIDLDTVMPTSVVWDFGDLVRSGACRTPEDETDLDRVALDLDLFAALARGYLAEMGPLLLAAELALLATIGPVICWEQALRFLADHLAGDRYYPARRRNHNLERARAQLALLASMTRQGAAMADAVADAGARLPAAPRPGARLPAEP